MSEKEQAQLLYDKFGANAPHVADEIIKSHMYLLELCTSGADRVIIKASIGMYHQIKEMLLNNNYVT